MFFCFNLLCIILSRRKHVCVSVRVCVLFCMPFFSVSCCVFVLKLFFSTCRNTPFVVCPLIPARSPSFYLSLLSVCAEARLCYFPECVCLFECVRVCLHWTVCAASSYLYCDVPWATCVVIFCLTALFSSFPIVPPSVTAHSCFCPCRPCVQSCALLIFLKPPPFTPGASLVVFVFVLIVAGPPHVWSGL